MSKLKQLKEKRATIFSSIDELRTTTDGKTMTGEEQQRWDAMLQDYDNIDKEITTEERFQEIQARQVGQTVEAEKPKDKGEEYRSAFASYLMSGAQGVTAEQRGLIEQRAGLGGLSGGVIVPSQLSSAIEVALKGYGGILEAGTIITTSTGGDLIMPTINDTATRAMVVNEYSESSEKAPSFGSVTLKAYTYRTPIVPVSQELLQDSSFDLEGLLSGLLAENFGRGLNEDLTIGDGEGRPKGLVNWAKDSGVVASATAIKLDDIIDLIKSVDSVYGQRGKFMFNRDTLYSLAKIKDTTGRYIWQEGAKDGTPPLLFGKQYVLNDDIQSVGAGNTSVLFGDLSKYRIRMVKDFRVIRLDELLAKYLSIGLFGFARADGALLDAGTGPVKKLTHTGSAS